MRPEQNSLSLLGITQSKAKMFEYDVPENYHIRITRNPDRLFTLAIGMLGDYSVRINSAGKGNRDLNEHPINLQFSARFFDAYLKARLNEDIDPYILILGSASYYLCDLPGSSMVLVNSFNGTSPDLGGFHLEELVLWLLKGDISTYSEGQTGPYDNLIKEISYELVEYYRSGGEVENLFNRLDELRALAYKHSTPRQLLFSDIISALVRKRYDNSTWYCMPLYTGIPKEQWRSALQKKSFIRELWPAQHLLGKHGVFNGKSAVVQMPTSAGKTRATEIIIRSSFLSGRTSLAIIVAPFRALCHEIKIGLIEAFSNESVNIDELSDVTQADFDIEISIKRHQILIVTPEKLIYVLRHNPELSKRIGLLIYDEGHQFDSGVRGITYELLLTSLKGMVADGTQTILLSAVISNAEAVNGWLTDGTGQVVSGTHLTPTYRTVCFASWLDQLGRLAFVAENDLDNEEFFVPRVIEKHKLKLRGREYIERFFPEKEDGKSIALYLGMKLSRKGSVAIFCGTKLTAAGLCERITDAYDRGLPISKPVEFSKRSEIRRLHFLHVSNLGADAGATQVAAFGVFAHHANTPHGIRLAVEHALKEGHAKVVICTSTLAQGVNLPIRYLIVTSIYQGQERIKVRDFHNLIGRVGRSGMHTEGSIIFTDPVIYDKRYSQNEKWRWYQVKNMLNPQNPEPCASTLLSFFDRLHSDDNKYSIKLDPLDIAKVYVDNPVNLASLIEKIVKAHRDINFTKKGLEEQIAWKMNIISAIESYLMAHWDDSEAGPKENDIIELAMATLAFYLSDDTQKDHIIQLFNLLARNIEINVKDDKKRKVFGRTLYGVHDSIAIEYWVSDNIEILKKCSDQEEMLMLLWTILESHIHNGTFNKCQPKEILKLVAIEWIRGKPYYELFKILAAEDARIGEGERPRRPTIEHIVDICENALAYDGSLTIGAVIEIIGLLMKEDNEFIITNLQELQKRIKYGLHSASVVALYELGFADRVIASELSSLLNSTSKNKKILVRNIKQQEKLIRETLRKYPSYYMNIANRYFN